MKITGIKKIVLCVCIAFTGSFLSAQIATPEGEMQGGNSKDTSHFIDKPSMHVHEETTVIEKKKASKNETASKSGNTNITDTAVTPGATNTASTVPDTIGNLSSTEGSAGNGMDNNANATVVTTQQNSTPLYTALTAFGIGALIGLFLLAMVLRNKRASRFMILLHGALGLVGIGMLIVYSMFYSGLVVTVAVLALAGTGGLLVFYKDINNEPIPKWLAVTHGVVAVAGVIMLAVYALAK